MKKLKLVAILFMAFTTLVSCKKDDPKEELEDIFAKYLSVEDGKIRLVDPTGVPGITGTAKDIDLTDTSVYPMLLIGKGFNNVTGVGWVYGNSKNPEVGATEVTVLDFFIEHSNFSFDNTNEKQKNIAFAINDLTPETTYYIRGFVKHNGKVSYSYNQLKITTQKEDKTGGSYSFD